MVALPALLVSLCVHEYAHAWVATKLGDSTPEREGRLTFSPVSHIDPLGTLLFPVVLILLGSPIFGWARPVSFQAANFTRRLTLWQGTALTASAGSIANLFLALLSALCLKLLSVLSLSAGRLEHMAGGYWMHFLATMFELNVLLAVFNLLPLPPLDGGHLIPASWHKTREFLTRNSFIIFMLVFLIPIPGIGSLGAIIISPLMMLIKSVLLQIVGVVV